MYTHTYTYIPTSSTSSWLAPSSPYAMFSATVPEKSTGS